MFIKNNIMQKTNYQVLKIMFTNLLLKYYLNFY